MSSSREDLLPADYVGPMTCKQINDLVEAFVLYQALLTVLITFGPSRIR